MHEMDNTLELGDTVQGSMMLEQAGLSRFEQNMVLTYTKRQRNTQTPGTMTARNKDNEHNAPDSMCELHEHKGQEMLPTASVG